MRNPLLVSLIIALSVTVLAAESHLTGYSINASSSKPVYEPGGTWKKITNSSANKYFIPTKTTTEWNAFNTNKPAAITIATGYPFHCLDIKEKNPSAASGTFSIDPEQDGTTISVSCDMTTDGGGWTLVARTAVYNSSIHDSCSNPSYTTSATCTAAGATWSKTSYPFGWNSSTGSLTDYNYPYSLNVGGKPISFTEVMIGQRQASSNLPGYNIIKRNFTKTLLTTYASTFDGVGGSWIQRTSWPYTSIPGMQSVMGFASNTTNFFMRDCCGNSNYGVGWDGMVTTYCGVAGYESTPGPYCGGDTLGNESKQVILFVR